MFKYNLNKSDFNEIKEFDIVHISNLDELKTTSNDIKKLIKYFNSEYHWDEMFTYVDVLNRLTNGHHLFILYYDSNPIGYVFFEPKKFDEFFLYNLYVTNKLKRPNYAPIWFVNKSISLIPASVKTIYCYCEEWNTAAHNIFEKNGFKK